MAPKVAHNRPRTLYFTVQPRNGQQPRIDSSYWEISGPDIYSLICALYLYYLLWILHFDEILDIGAQVLPFLGWFGLVHCRPVSLIYWTRRWGQFTILSLYQIPTVAKAPLIICIFFLYGKLLLFDDSMLYLLYLAIVLEWVFFSSLANVLHDHIGKNQPPPSDKNEDKPYNHTQSNKVNDFCFVSKCLHISNSCLIYSLK